MASIESAVSEQLARSFTVCIPYELQPGMELLPADTRHTLLGELFRLAVQAWQERCLLPRHGPVTLEFLLAGCDVGIELDALRARLTLVSLIRGRSRGPRPRAVLHSSTLSPGPSVSVLSE